MENFLTIGGKRYRQTITPVERNKRKVFISAGHGPNASGEEWGAYNPGVKISEYTLNLLGAHTTVDDLKEAPNLIPTFYDDPNTLWGTGKASQGHDIAIEVHHNAANGVAQGVEGWSHKTHGDPMDIKLLEFICAEISHEIGIPNRGVKQANFGFLSGAEAVEHHKDTNASGLIEFYFMDAENDRAKMLDMTKRAGHAMARGIIKFDEYMEKQK